MKDPSILKPTRAISAYIYFSNEMVPKFKQEKGISHKEAMKETGDLWKTLSDEQKKKYDDMHEADVERYSKQLKSLFEKGYFIMEDGTKSSEVEIAGKKKKATREEQKPKKRKSHLSAGSDNDAHQDEKVKKAKKGERAKI